MLMLTIKPRWRVTMASAKRSTGTETISLNAVIILALCNEKFDSYRCAVMHIWDAGFKNFEKRL